jgi:SAM-dependent methyltransferase
MRLSDLFTKDQWFARAVRFAAFNICLSLVLVPVLAQEGHRGTPSGDALPSIDCPLHRAGIDPSKLKPFEEVEKYIAFLERPDRARWQKPDEIIQGLGLTGEETVADIGAGSGYFTFRLSKMLPKGRVIAIDNDPEMIRHIHRKARSEGFANVIAQLATSEDPQLPVGVNLVFLCDVLMHVRHRDPWLKKIHDQMPEGGRLVLIDFKAGHLPEGPPEAMKVPKTKILEICSQAGFQLETDHSLLLPYQEFLIFRRPLAGEGKPTGKPN